MQPIDFYFDFASPYGYFMSQRIDALAAEHGRSVVWRPILLFAALRALGLPPPLEHPVKLAYTKADFARSASFMGIDYQLPPTFPAVTQHAARAFYLLQAQAPATAMPFAHAALRSYFVEGRDIASLDVIAQLVLDQNGLPGGLAGIREQLKSDGAKAMLASAIDAAVARQVFGSPFVIIDGESFFGVDRLPQIAAKLAGRG